MTDVDKKSWKYICVKGLGFINGICCPHHDTVQSNGVRRSEDFDTMLLRRNKNRKRRKEVSHPSHREDGEETDQEIGVCIDDQAALVIDGNMFRVVATEEASASTAVRRKKVRRVAVNDDDDNAIERGEGQQVVEETTFLPSVTYYPLSDLIDC